MKNIISEIVQEWPEYKKSRKTDSRSKGCALLNCPMVQSGFSERNVSTVKSTYARNMSEAF